MGIITSNKYADVQTTACTGQFTVTLGLSAAPSLTGTADVTPTAFALVIDASAGVAGAPLDNIKASATELIDALAENAGADGTLCCGHEAAIVSYGTQGTIVEPLTDNPTVLRNAIAGITSSGNSNLAAGITQGVAALSAAAANARKVMFVYTDGSYNVGTDPFDAAQAAKDAGITLYFVAENISEPADIDQMGQWSTQPAAAYIITDYQDGSGTYGNFISNLAANTDLDGAAGITVAETVAADFRIVSTSAPTVGTVTVTGARTLTWNIPSLAADEWEGAALSFTVAHSGSTSGPKNVNESIVYTDTTGNTAAFNNPEILVDCGEIDYIDPCAEPVESVSSSCDELITIDAGEVSLGLAGRMAQVSLTLRNVCPNRRVAVAVILTELDGEGVEQQRGMRTLTIPAHTFDTCRDINVSCIKFVLPEDLASDAPPCGERVFRARVYANVIDSGVECCEQ